LLIFSIRLWSVKMQYRLSDIYKIEYRFKNFVFCERQVWIILKLTERYLFELFLICGC